MKPNEIPGNTAPGQVVEPKDERSTKATPPPPKINLTNKLLILMLELQLNNCQQCGGRGKRFDSGARCDFECEACGDVRSQLNEIRQNIRED